jgi:hypothetical protein
MPDPKVLVDRISEVSPPVEAPAAKAGQPPRLVEVKFQGGRSGLLDMTQPHSAFWADLLGSLRERNEPVYVLIDPESNVITKVLYPLTVTVGEIDESAEGDEVEVELIISHARHYLRRSNPDFKELLKALKEARKDGATVAVTEKLEEHEIIDVRVIPYPKMPAAVMPPPEIPEIPRVSVSPQRAQQLFDLVSIRTCCPRSGTAPCIPFQFPDDGCWGRAHEMCRLMIGAGTVPGKVWIYGSLRVITANHYDCMVQWSYHVAPILMVSTGAGPVVTVIDPSMFPGPVDQATWVGAQGNPSPTVVITDASIFYRNSSGGVIYDDANYTKTKQVLDKYRDDLRIRTEHFGPPPYIQCLTKPPGVNFFGTIGPGETRVWYTINWPASWHVVWTVMPITHCPRGPQLSWKVQVGRSDASRCTYWIVVKNPTSDPVRFEARYDILSK